MNFSGALGCTPGRSD